MRCALAAAPANTSATIAMLPTVAIPPPRSADHAAPRPERPSATTAAITVTPACPSTTPKASRRACGRSIANTLYKSRSRGSKEPLFLRFEHGASGLLSSAVQSLTRLRRKSRGIIESAWTAVHSASTYSDTGPWAPGLTDMREDPVELVQAIEGHDEPAAALGGMLD